MLKITWNNDNFDSVEILKKEKIHFFSPSVLVGLTHYFNDNNCFLTNYLSDRFIVAKEKNKINLINNFCLHKNAKMISDINQIKNGKIVCPVHHWAFNTSGKLLKAPYSDFDCSSANLTINTNAEIYEYKNLLLTDKNLIEELQKSEFNKNLNFDDYVIVHQDSDSYEGNWKDFGVVYNDATHVRMRHPELASIVEVGTTEWELGYRYASHRHKFKPEWRNQNNPLTNALKNIENAGFKVGGEDDFAVTFLNLFPNVFIDRWNGFITFDVVEPISEDKYMLHCTILCKKELAVNKELVEGYLIPYLRVGDEDSEILTSVYEGRKNIFTKDSLYQELIIESTELGNYNYIKWLSEAGKEFYFGKFNCEQV